MHPLHPNHLRVFLRFLADITHILSVSVMVPCFCYVLSPTDVLSWAGDCPCMELPISGTLRWVACLGCMWVREGHRRSVLCFQSSLCKVSKPSDFITVYCISLYNQASFSWGKPKLVSFETSVSSSNKPDVLVSSLSVVFLLYLPSAVNLTSHALLSPL